MVESRTLLKSLLADLTVSALEKKLAPTVLLQSALTEFEGLSRKELVELIVAESLVTPDREITHHLSSATHEIAVVGGELNGEASQQLLFAAYDADGKIVELKSYFKYMYPFTQVREAVQQAFPDLPSEVWALRDDLAPDDGALHSSKPSLPYAPSLKFASPVIRLAATPETLANKVLSHASSIYGSRNYSDFALVDGDQRYSVFTGDVGGQKIEIPIIATLQDGKAIEIVAFGRPWRASLALYSRIKLRLIDELGAEYFYPAQKDYSDYLTHSQPAVA